MYIYIYIHIYIYIYIYRSIYIYITRAASQHHAWREHPMQLHIETLITCKLSPREFAAKNDIY